MRTRNAIHFMYLVIGLWMIAVGVFGGCNRELKGHAVLTEGSLQQPADKYVSIQNHGQEIAYVDATCRAHAGALLKKKVDDLPCLRPSGECDSDDQKQVNLKLNAQRAVENAMDKKLDQICEDVNARIRGGQK